MNKARIFLAYCALSLVLLPLHLLLAWPAIPASAAGWAALAFLPIPISVASEWILAYRPFKVFRRIDKVGELIAQSPYRLPVVVTIVIAAGGVTFLLGLLLSSDRPF